MDSTERGLEVRKNRQLTVIMSNVLDRCSLILLAIAGLVVYDWQGIPQGPLRVEVAQAGDVRQEQAHYYIPFKVQNTGGETANTAQVIAEL